MSAVTESVIPRDLSALAAQGIWSPIIMPLSADLTIDQGRFISLAEGLLDAGCHGLAVFGTTSEATSFSVDERIALLDAALESGLAPERMMVGTGCCAYTDTLRLTRHAAERGCKKVLLLPPFYYKNMSDVGLAESFFRVIEGVSDPELRMFLYHFPRLSGVPVTLGLVGRLVERFPVTIAGVKDSSGDWSNTQALLEQFPELAIFPGSERFLLQGLRHGAAGCITATANVNAQPIRAVFNAWQDGAGDVDTLQLQITQTRDVIDGYPMVPALKYITAARYEDEAWRRVRPPMVELDADAGQRLLKELSDTGAG